jgi:EmrB/QacA subfamily drug resistance transporter
VKAASALDTGVTGDASKRLLPWLVAIAFFMEALDATILNTAVPSIASALKVAPLSMKAVLSSYTLAVAVFVPLSGWLADRFGTRRLFSTAIAVFTTGSLLCGLSNSIHALVACRVLQGMGGAMLVPVGRLTIVRAFPKAELVRAMSFVVIPALVGPMLGPVAGGLIVHYLPWRTIFFVNLPIGLLGLFLVYRHLPDFRGPGGRPLDWLGLVLFSSGLALLSYVLEVFGEHTLSGREILGLLFISLALLTAYGRYALTTPHPLLQFSLTRIRTFRVAVGGGFITRLAAGGMPFLLPLLYQVGIGYTPVQAALLIVPQPLAAMGLKFTVPAILKRFGYRRVLRWNTMSMGVLIGLFSLIGPGTPVWQILLQGFMFGFCLSMQYSSTNTLVYADIPALDSSMASTISSTMQQLSMSFGVALASLSAAVFLPNRFHTNAAQMIHGLHLAFLALGILTIVSATIFNTLKDGDGAGIARDTSTIPATRLGD